MEAPAKDGIVYLQVVKFGKKSWKKTWTMVFQASASGIGRLEMWDVRDGGLGPPKPPLRRGDRRVIRLVDCLSVHPVPEESCPPDCMAFCLNTTQRTYTLAAGPFDDWVSKLCQLAFQSETNQSWLMRSRSEEMPMAENEIYSSWKTVQYKVTLQRTEAVVRCGLSGSYLLSLSQEAITLLDLTTSKTIYNWPYRLLRRFGQDKEGVTIEAGRRCDSGEGHFTFLSKHVAEIYAAIENAIKQQSVLSQEPRCTSRCASTKMASYGKRKDQMLPLPECPERNAAVMPPRDVFFPNTVGKPALQQPGNAQAEWEESVYSTLQIPAGEKLPPTIPKAQGSPSALPHRRNEHLWEDEEQAEYEADDEERLCSLESICLSDALEGYGAVQSPLYYNLTGSFGELEKEEEGKEEGQGNVQWDYCGTQYLNSTFSFQQSLVTPPPEDGRQSLAENVPSVITTTEIPVDFKQKLSDMLFRDPAKVQPQLCIKYTDIARTMSSQERAKQELYN